MGLRGGGFERVNPFLVLSAKAFAAFFELGVLKRVCGTHTGPLPTLSAAAPATSCVTPVHLVVHFVVLPASTPSVLPPPAPLRAPAAPPSLSSPLPSKGDAGDDEREVGIDWSRKPFPGICRNVAG